MLTTLKGNLVEKQRLDSQLYYFFYTRPLLTASSGVAGLGPSDVRYPQMFDDILRYSQHRSADIISLKL